MFKTRQRILWKFRRRRHRGLPWPLRVSRSTTETTVAREHLTRPKTVHSTHGSHMPQSWRHQRAATGTPHGPDKRTQKVAAERTKLFFAFTIRRERAAMETVVALRTVRVNCALGLRIASYFVKVPDLDIKEVHIVGTERMAVVLQQRSQ